MRSFSPLFPLMSLHLSTAHGSIFLMITCPGGWIFRATCLMGTGDARCLIAVKGSVERRTTAQLTYRGRVLVPANLN